MPKLVFGGPTLAVNLLQWCLTKDLPRVSNIGVDTQGHFRTTHLTEYPPAVCAAFAQATVDAVLSHPVANFEADADFLAQCAAMTVLEISSGLILQPDRQRPEFLARRQRSAALCL